MKALVTGFTGSLGSELTKLLLDDGIHVVGYSRDELKQSQFPNHPKLIKYLGDIRDRDRLLEASRNCDIVFHTAALKQVDRLEENPEEAIATNVTGTENILYSQRINHIPRVVLSSTDKAVYPINTYGATKALAERLVLRNENNVVCRYGNVFASRGSVIPSFIKSLKEENLIRITDKRMTRFFIKVSEAAEFVARSSIKPQGGLYIPQMKSYPVLKLALLIADILQVRNPKVLEIGIRAGEKLHENLRTEFEGGEVISSDDKLFFKEKELRDYIANAIS